MLIPVRFENSASGAITITPDVVVVEEPTLKELKITEAVLEEFVRANVETLFPEGETLLIVGQQTRNKAGGRADLVAIDGEGSIVLIELKRDAEDIVARREPFEFQAIRYAASYALITTPQDLVQKLFAPYIEKHKAAYDLTTLTPSELASRRLTSYLRENKAESSFNLRQRIVLIASKFDEQTRSACSWLAKNKIDIRCICLTPIKYGEQYFFDVEQIVPPPSLDQYFVDIAEAGGGGIKQDKEGDLPIPRANLPKMPQLLEWNLVAPNDKIYIKDHEPEAAEILDQRYVKYCGQSMTYNAWGQKVTGWSAINIYEWTVHEATGQTLDKLRRDKVAELEQEASEPIIDADLAMG